MSQEQRRLAAIMFTDIVGYTGLVQENESAMMSLLENHRRMLRPIFIKHRGREIKTIGDAFLVEFESALEATLCAIDIQSSMHSLNLERGEKLMVRVGIHLGDVIHRENDVLGDSVNIASRIEPLAAPGGITVSGQVYDDVRYKLTYPLVKLGDRELRNVREPVEVYNVVLPWGDNSPGGQSVFDKKRIAVLPLVSMSPDPNDEYFADGMTEELISALSKIGGLKVIARTSVMGYKGMHKKVSEIAKELEVGTVLEGSVRKAGNTVRITVQMIDSQSSDHLWAESYDRELKDVFGIQSDISKSVAESLKVQLLPREKAIMDEEKEVKSEAFDKYLLAKQKIRSGATMQALKLLEESIVLDSNFAPAYSELAQTYVTAAGELMLPSEAFAKARVNLSKAMDLDDKLLEAWLAKANLAFQSEWDWEGADRAFRRAIELNPSSAEAYRLRSYLTFGQGLVREAINYAQKAVELDPLSLFARWRLGSLYALAGLRNDALLESQRIKTLHPVDLNAQNFVSTIYFELGLLEEAQKEFDGLRTTMKSNNVPITDLYAAWSYAINAFIYSSNGSLQKVREMIGESEGVARRGYFSPSILGILYLALGEKEKGLALLEEGIDMHDPDLLLVWFYSCFKPYFSEPRFLTLLRKVGVPESMLIR